MDSSGDQNQKNTCSSATNGLRKGIDATRGGRRKKELEMKVGH
jgi:hypothetical protein